MIKGSKKRRIIIAVSVLCFLCVIGIVISHFRWKAKLNEVRERIPRYFEYSTDNGLTIYYITVAKDAFQCILQEGKAGINTPVIDTKEFYNEGCTLEEMQVILKYYGISPEDVVLRPGQAFTSYIEVDRLDDPEKWEKELKKRFFR